MIGMFEKLFGFNAEILAWDISGVSDMSYTGLFAILSTKTYPNGMSGKFSSFH